MISIHPLNLSYVGSQIHNFEYCFTIWLNNAEQWGEVFIALMDKRSMAEQRCLEKHSTAKYTVLKVIYILFRGLQLLIKRCARRGDVCQEAIIFQVGSVVAQTNNGYTSHWITPRRVWQADYWSGKQYQIHQALI